MSENSDVILLGKISGVFGVKGWVKVHSYTDPREGIAQYKRWYLKRKGQKGKLPSIKVKNGKKQAKTVIAQLDGINNRTQAEAMIGLEIAIKKEQLAKLPEGEYYWSQLEGLQVNTTDGNTIGEVDYVFATGANDVLSVQKDDGNTCLIPFLVGDVIKHIDLETSTMTADWDPDF